MKELNHLKSDPKLLMRWAHSFVETCFGFNFHRDYRLFYSDIGRNWRPTLQVVREGQNVCTIEVGQPALKRHKAIPYGLLFTGEEWRLYDMDAPGGIALMAVCDLRPYLKGEVTEKKMIELEKDLAPFHETAYQSKVWEELALEARKCAHESVTGVMLSPDVLQMIHERLGLLAKEPPCYNLLRHKIVDMLEAQTPVKATHKAKRPDDSAA